MVIIDGDHRTGPETERLFLREFTVDDVESYLTLRSDPEILRYTGDAPLRSLEEARQAILDYPDFQTVGFGRWACVLKETGRAVGFCGLKYLEELDEVDLGYRFLTEYWGRGLATESSLASLEYGFRVLRLERILGLARPENHASIRVLEKVGMKPDGEVLYFGLPALRFCATRDGGGGGAELSSSRPR